jgi:4-hydroxymandelate oxidase
MGPCLPPTMRPVPDHPASSDGSVHNPPAGTLRSAGATPLALDLSLDDLERDARRIIGEMAYAYFAGGAEDEHLLARAVAAWRGWELHPRVLAGISEVATGTTLLGQAVSSPVVIAPTAIQGLAHPEGEMATARGAAQAGALMVLSSLATCSLEEVDAAAPGAPRWMQVYILRDRARTEDLVHRAAAHHYGALVLTVDAPVSGLRLRELRSGVHLPDDLSLPNLTGESTARAHEGGFMAVVTREFEPALTPDDIGWLAGLSDLPVVAKGVQRADDALRCVEAGAAAIVVSNHGARQLDDAPPTADILAEIVDAVAGRVEVYVDGGLRRAPDVAKALALGARAVLVGRPSLWALAAGGPDGVAALLDWYQSELARTMALCGAATVDALDRSLVRRALGCGPTAAPTGGVQ